MSKQKREKQRLNARMLEEITQLREENLKLFRENEQLKRSIPEGES